LGTWQWGSREWGWPRTHTKEDVLSALQKAVELGINFLDTAEVYGRGKSEELLGEAIRGHRDELVIATKVWPSHLTYGGVLRAAERSLRRLGVDAIDLYQIHWPSPIIPIGRTMKAMKDLLRSEKVRAVGVSNFNLQKMKAAQQALAPYGLASNQVKYNLLDRGVESELLPYARQEGISIIAYSPLAKGFLAGKYKPGTAPDSLIQKMNPRFSERNLKKAASLFELLSQMGRSYGKSVSQIALNWLLRHESVIPIPGVKKPEHVVDDAGAVDWRMRDEDAKKLEEAASELKLDKISGLPNLIKILTRR